jgi:predicted unusual protein kinase regulating ubiquinone biosynthesis (AarF/ABC1/UbiB family)
MCAQVHKAKLLAPSRWGGAPRDGLVAVKVQYPNALETMLQDLQNIRVAGRFLSARALHLDFLLSLTYALRL